MQNAAGSKTGAAVVAAGMSSRIGDFNPQLDLDRISFVQRTIATFEQAGVQSIALVSGYPCQARILDHTTGMLLRAIDHDGSVKEARVAPIGKCGICFRRWKRRRGSPGWSRRQVGHARKEPAYADRRGTAAKI